MGGLDSVLSILQMPSGIPVAAMPVGKAGGANAALFAVSILAAAGGAYADKLEKYREEQSKKVVDKNARLGKIGYKEYLKELRGSEMIEHGLTGTPAQKVLILDFGSQYTQLIARRIRELNVYAEIVPFHHPVKEIIKEKPSAIMLSGGPSSIYEKGAPHIDGGDLHAGHPGAGHLLRALHGGRGIQRGNRGRLAPRNTAGPSSTSRGNRRSSRDSRRRRQVWMSHGDKVVKPPRGFTVMASSENAEIAAIENPRKTILRRPVPSGSVSYRQRDEGPRKIFFSTYAGSSRPGP